MVKRKVIWSDDAIEEMFEIMKYYIFRNKSKTYSNKLYKDIKLILKTLDFSITFPRKTSDKKLFYIIHNHILVGFDIVDNDLFVQLVSDERRNPDFLSQFLSNLT